MVFSLSLNFQPKHKCRAKKRRKMSARKYFLSFHCAEVIHCVCGRRWCCRMRKFMSRVKKKNDHLDFNFVFNNLFFLFTPIAAVSLRLNDRNVYVHVNDTHSYKALSTSQCLFYVLLAVFLRTALNNFLYHRYVYRKVCNHKSNDYYRRNASNRADYIKENNSCVCAS